MVQKSKTPSKAPVAKTAAKSASGDKKPVQKVDVSKTARAHAAPAKTPAVTAKSVNVKKAAAPVKVAAKTAAPAKKPAVAAAVVAKKPAVAVAAVKAAAKPAAAGKPVAVKPAAAPAAAKPAASHPAPAHSLASQAAGRHNSALQAAAAKSAATKAGAAAKPGHANPGLMPQATRPISVAPARTVPAAVAKSGAPKMTAPAGAPAQPMSPKAIAEKAAAARRAMVAQTPAPSLAPKKPVNQRHGFKANEFIVYPAHGVGRIVGIEEQEIAGMTLELFVITFDKEKLTLRVPTGKLESVGMRKLADDGEVKKAMETLKGRARIKRTMWSRRAQEYVAKINSGNLVSIAEVVRDLYRSDAQPEQSYSERQLYEDALDRMARELAAVERLDDRGAVQRITEVLSKSARGRRAAETEADAGDDAEAEIKAA